MPKRYFRRRWNESRGDQHDAWGAAEYFFETDESLAPLRQIEAYEGGQRLLYDASHNEDAYGMLASESLSAWDEDPELFEIAADEFEVQWSSGRRT